MSHAVDLAEAQPSFLRRTPTKDSTAMTTPAPAKAPKTKRKDCLNVTIKVQIPVTDRASLDAAYEASDDAKAESSWPAGSVIAVTNVLGKV